MLLFGSDLPGRILLVFLALLLVVEGFCVVGARAILISLLLQLLNFISDIELSFISLNLLLWTLVHSLDSRLRLVALSSVFDVQRNLLVYDAI